MMVETKQAQVSAHAVSDRGLSQKRPLNEDSYLVDPQHGIYAVADGVGGAQAGDVASQTAIDVIADAFGHRRDGDDVEDLMEIAIQRANVAIHQMSLEHQKLAMMATTIVALHTDGRQATIGHAGDSRLYRLTPDGQLHRETEDHSMVEDEVRAGRLTPEQAVHHPGRNVISRALGAEESVEVDLKTIEVSDGTRFLLCSDGITRHIADGELRALLANTSDGETVCAELKRLCFERGAEDNLTAVVVQVGDEIKHAPSPVVAQDDEEPTIAQPRPVELTTATPSHNATSKRPFSKVVVTPAGERAAPPLPRRRSTLLPLMLLLLPIIGAAAFYGGMLFESQREKPATAPSSTAADATPSSPEAKYDAARREVDRAPREEAARMQREAKGAPLASPDPEFLYLYGRALLLSGEHHAALEAFRTVIVRLDENSAAGARDPLRVEARLSAAAAALKVHDGAALQAVARELDEVIVARDQEPGGTQ